MPACCLKKKAVSRVMPKVIKPYKSHQSGSGQYYNNINNDD